MSTFEIGQEDFLLDGRPFRILSGALHYFRVHPDQWADRIEKARAMGLNTIETYVAWNAHAPRREQFDLTGPLDLGRFLDLVAEAGMRAIVRPGPYICAEWHNGGLPTWLLSDGRVGLRRHEPVYLAAVEEYLEALAPVLVPRQIDRGGPIVLVQVENEYGAYGDDHDYLRHLVEVNRRTGITVPLTSVDQPTDQMLVAGSVPGLHRTASFGSRPLERLKKLREHQPTGPLMCSEFWVGWFDSWGGHHHTTDVASAADDLDTLLATGASVNIYMFHGGTNYGLTNGANDKGVYRPIATTYDYDAPLDEAGNPTAKYLAFRDVLTRHAAAESAAAPSLARPAPEFTVEVEQVLPWARVRDELGVWSAHGPEVTMDHLGHHAGLMVYRAEIGTLATTVLEVDEVRDRAQVFLDGDPVGVLSRELGEHRLPLPGGRVLEVLVEDLGRVNYGPRLGEAKGLIGPARLDGRPLAGWDVLPVDLARVPHVVPGHPGARPRASHPLAGPVFATGRFDVPECTDLFLDTTGWGKGLVWINGFLLGRYWSRGPQRTLYVPSPVLRPVGNELVVLEQHVALGELRFVEGPDLGHTEI